MFITVMRLYKKILNLKYKIKFFGILIYIQYIKFESFLVNMF